MNKPKREPPKAFKMEGYIYKTQGLHEISNLNLRLTLAGYKMGDDVEVTVKLIKKENRA